MQKKKVRDILPPRRVKAHEPEKATPSSLVQRSPQRTPRRMLFFLLFVVLIGGITGVLSLHFFFAKVWIIVHPYTREVTAKASMTARAGIEGTDIEKSISALIINEEKSLTRLFPATGISTEEGRARGTIRVFNGFSTFPQKLVAQTRFLSEDGKLFRSPGAVVVPAGRMEGGSIIAGFLDIEVVAAESKEEYNIGPSNFSLPGLFGNPAYTTITGKSSEPMTGGSKTEVSVVTESDLNAARDALMAELQQDVRESLEGKVPEGMILLSDAVDLRVVQASSPIKAAAPLDNFNFSVKVQGVAIVFSKADVENAAKTLLANLTEGGEKIAERADSIEYENVEMNMSAQSLSFDMRASTRTYKEIDPVEFKARLAGISKDEAALALSLNPSLQKAEILLFPFWLTYLPQDPNKVEVSIVID
ncbi:MAG: hypothetical protein Q7S62_02595 [bacterium]|nr:hypothetical protein [bacterium]